MSTNEKQVAVSGDCLLTLDDVAKLTTFCKNSVRLRARDGRFPPPVSLDGRIAWRRSAVERWMESLPVADSTQRASA
jgi:predicted DNA-binding transcriptional regulator AlpA